MRPFGWIVVCICLVAAPAGLAVAQEPDVAKLTAALSGDTGAQAADSLARLGPRAKAAVPELIKTLDNKDSNVSWRAARTLGSIGPSAVSAAPALIKHLADKDAAMRTQCVAALGKIGAADDKSVTAIGKSVGDEEPHVRRAAIQALGRVKADPKVVIPILLQVVHDAQPDVAMPAMAALSDMGEAAVPALVDALAVKESRHWAAVVIAEMGPKAAPAAPALARMIKDDEPEVRMQAVIALGQLGPAAKSSIPAIVAALKDPEPAVRYGAAFAIGKLRAQEGADEISRLTESDDPTLKLVACWALARIHPDDSTAIRKAMEAIAEGLRSEDAQLSRTAARALAEIDGSSVALTPAIKAALDEMDPTVLEHVMEALAAVGAEAVPVLIAATTDPKTRGAAIRALGHLGPAAKPAAAALTEALGDKDLQIASDAALALGAIGPDAAKSVPALSALLSKEDPGARYAAVLALGRIGPAAKSAVPALQKQVAGKEAMMTIASVWAVKRIDPTNRALAPAAMPVLTKLAASNDEIMRLQAAGALGDLGPDARDALPVLKKLLEDTHEDVRRTASESIAKIQGTPANGKAPPAKGQTGPAKSQPVPAKGK